MGSGNGETDIFDSLNYVSRGGQKLAKALDYFTVDPHGKVCIDCGASTGGFTDCLLQRGARFVYSVDVGYGQLAWTLRNDPRVCVMERTNIRYVTPEMLTAHYKENPGGSGPGISNPGSLDSVSRSEKPTLAVVDLSFISLALVLPVIHNLGVSEAVCLIKPQFEAGRGKVGKKGVVRDPQTHVEVLQAFMQHAESSGFTIRGITHSPVKGPKGNIEYLGYLTAAGVCESGESTGSSGKDSGSANSSKSIKQGNIPDIVARSHKELDG